MIQYLYETHLQVHDLDASIAFYEKLGLRLGLRNGNVAFFYIGESNQQLGLWLVPKEHEIDKRHFAFHVTLEDLLNSKKWLAERDIELIPNKGFSPDEPVVHAWVPAASVYFLDLDGNKLEFISILPDEPMNLENRVNLSEWNELKKNKK